MIIIKITQSGSILILSVPWLKALKHAASKHHFIFTHTHARTHAHTHVHNHTHTHTRTQTQTHFLTMLEHEPVQKLHDSAATSVVVVFSPINKVAQPETQ
ncbi:MAG: hypothetical protein LGB05_08215, partial [Sulfurovum sp.]|nr:hypothetical protein [Sulfurovum sp.]